MKQADETLWRRPVIGAESRQALKVSFNRPRPRSQPARAPGVTVGFFTAVKTVETNVSSIEGIDVVVLHGCSEYVIPKEGPGTARDEGGIAGADAPSSEGAAGSSR
jgi:hypothetical protein